MTEQGKSVVHPAPATVNAYNKVCLEKIGLNLEIQKLEAFLENPKYVSEDMVEAMQEQLKGMKAYDVALSQRIKIFLIENPSLVDEKYPETLGQVTIGTFNPNDNTKVAELKNRATQFINCIDAFGIEPRRKAIAVTKIEEAQMFAVKSLFH